MDQGRDMQRATEGQRRTAVENGRERQRLRTEIERVNIRLGWWRRVSWA